MKFFFGSPMPFSQAYAPQIFNKTVAFRRVSIVVWPRSFTKQPIVPIQIIFCTKEKVVKSVLSVCFFGLILSGMAASQVSLPEDTQVQLLVKGLTYNSKLKGANLLVLSRSENNTNRANASSLFSGKSVKSNSVQVFDGAYSGRDNLLAILDALGAHLVYLCDDLTDEQTAEISKICGQKGVLTMSGVPMFVERGLVSMSVLADEGKPKIILGMGRLKSEGHSFSPQFLKLCKIVE